MKLYSLLILTKNTKKAQNNFKTPKKSEIGLAIFPGRILPCNTSQQYTAPYTTYSHVLDGEIKAIAANWCRPIIVRTWGGYTCSTDCLPKAGPTASPCGPML